MARAKNISVQPLLVDVPNTALMMDISEETVWRMLARRELESILVGKSRKIRITEIERYLEENTIPVRKAS